MLRPDPHRSSFLLMLALSAGLAACATIPEIGPFPAATSGPPPALLPLDDLLAQAAVPGRAEPVSGALAARAARLRARAALMRGPVHDPATRDRLALAIRHGRA
jgi:hypothetical protein